MTLKPGCVTCEHVADIRGIDLTQPTPEAVAAYAVSDDMLNGRIPSSELGRAAKSLEFIRDAIHRDGPDADAIRETLGLRDQCRHLCTCGGDWGGFSHAMSDRHEPRAPERRVVGEWQEVQP